MPGPSPVDRGNPGSKIHALSGRAGLPASVAVSAADHADANPPHTDKALTRLVAGLQLESCRLTRVMSCRARTSHTYDRTR